MFHTTVGHTIWMLLFFLYVAFRIKVEQGFSDFTEKFGRVKGDNVY